ncbi:MAG: sialidase family protein [Acidimicrobiales bacterium]
MTTPSRRRIGLLALMGALLVGGPASAADPPVLTTPVQVTKSDLDPQRTYSAPALAVSPEDPEVIVGGYVEFRTKRCSLMRSTDAGATWTLLDSSPALESYPFCLANNSNVFQAPIAFGSDNALYMAMAAWDTPDTRNQVSVQLARSTDLGDTWSSTLVRDARATQDPRQESNRPVTDVAVDTSGDEDVVYVTYRRGLRNQPEGSDAPSQPMIAVSTDGGRTFAEPVSALGAYFDSSQTRSQAIGAATTVPNTTTTTVPPPGSLAAQPDQAANFGGGNPSVTVDDEGTAYVAWKSTTSNIASDPPGGIFVSKSTDQGKTWEVHQARPYSYSIGGSSVIPQLVWSSEGGSQGTLHLVYDDSDRPEVANYSTIYHVRSTDGGTTWTEPQVLADIDADLVRGQFIPNLDVAPNGRVDVAWWDTRDDPGIRANDVYYTYSTDNGSTWSKNIRITDQTIDRRFGVWGNNFDQNSPPSLASADAYAIFGWDGTRFSRGEDGEVEFTPPADGPGGGVQDIFISAAQFESVGGGMSTALQVALAAVAGLLLVGLALVVSALVMRRREGGSLFPSGKPARTKAEVG